MHYDFLFPRVLSLLLFIYSFCDYFFFLLLVYITDDVVKTLSHCINKFGSTQ